MVRPASGPFLLWYILLLSKLCLPVPMLTVVFKGERDLLKLCRLVFYFVRSFDELILDIGEMALALMLLHKRA